MIIGDTQRFQFGLISESNSFTFRLFQHIQKIRLTCRNDEIVQPAKGALDSAPNEALSTMPVSIN